MILLNLTPVCLPKLNKETMSLSHLTLLTVLSTRSLKGENLLALLTSFVLFPSWQTQGENNRPYCDIPGLK